MQSVSGFPNLWPHLRAQLCSHTPASSPIYSSVLQRHWSRHMGFTSLAFSFQNTPALLPEQQFLFSADKTNRAEPTAWAMLTWTTETHETVRMGPRRRTSSRARSCRNIWKTQGPKQHTNPSGFTRRLSFL